MFFLQSTELSAKIRLITFHYNRPDFLELQIELFRKFIVDDYELIVFNDAPGDVCEREIREMCEEHGVRCLRYEQNWHASDKLIQQVWDWGQHPAYKRSYFGFGKGATLEAIAGSVSVRHSQVIQYALESVGYDHDDIVVIVDGDLFPIRRVSLRSLMEGYGLVGSPLIVGGVEYMWVPFVAMDMRCLPNKRDLNFSVGCVDHCMYDTGAQSYFYLLNHPEVSVSKYPIYGKCHRYLNVEQYKELPFDPRERVLIRRMLKDTNVEFHIDFHFMHFSGSSWANASAKKVKYVKEFLGRLLI